MSFVTITDVFSYTSTLNVVNFYISPKRLEWKCKSTHHVSEVSSVLVQILSKNTTHALCGVSCVWKFVVLF